MPEIVIPGPWQVHTYGKKVVCVPGTTVGEALAELAGRYPVLAAQIFTAEEGVRRSLHLFLHEREVHNLQGAQTPLAAGDRLIIVLPIGGG